MIKRFVITFDSGFESVQLKGMIDGALSFQIDEAVNASMFRDLEGRKSYPQCDFSVKEFDAGEFDVWLQANRLKQHLFLGHELSNVIEQFLRSND